MSAGGGRAEGGHCRWQLRLNQNEGDGEVAKRQSSDDEQQIRIAANSIVWLKKTSDSSKAEGCRRRGGEVSGLACAVESGYSHVTDLLLGFRFACDSPRRAAYGSAKKYTHSTLTLTHTPTHTHKQCTVCSPSVTKLCAECIHYLI